MVSSLAAREHDVEAFLRLRIEAWDVLGLLLEITVHDDCPSAPALGESGCDRRMLSEITAESDRAYGWIGHGERSQPVPRAVRASIVHEDQLVAIAYPAESSRDPLV